MADLDEYRLAHEFYDAYKSYIDLNKPDARVWEQDELDDLSVKLKAIAHRVMQLRLFSPNEELEDVSTADLKFLLVPFLLAEVTAATRDMETRLESLRKAIIYWKAFGHDCERLGIAHQDDVKAFNRSPEEALDPNSKRDEKIARYKRTKELDNKVAYLFGKKKEVLGDEYHWGSGGSFDEDMERDLIMALLGRACGSVADNVFSAEQELPLLEMMRARGGPSKGPPPEQKLPSEKPFILRIQDKAELMKIYKEMVFQCPHALPTVSIADAADYEIAEMHEREAKMKDMEHWKKVREDERWYDGDRYGAKEAEEDEQKTYKDRDWDDWKDEHPFGCGNKMNNMG